MIALFVESRRQTEKYADGGGLFLFIPASGKKSGGWRTVYRRPKLLSFGEYPEGVASVPRGNAG